MDSVGEGESGKIWENDIETCKTSCMKRVVSPGSMHDTGCLGLVSLEEKMATHSSIIAGIIPWTEEPGGLQSTGLQRVGHD